MNTSTSTLEAVREIISETLGIGPERIAGAHTQLFGSIPELDSFGIVGLAGALEARFGFEIDDSEFTAEIFETVGSLADFVDRSLQAQAVPPS